MEKVEIFEKEQAAEIAENADEDQNFLFYLIVRSADEESDRVIDERGGQQEDQINRLPTAIKIEACD
jgi:hypothetical protein